MLFIWDRQIDIQLNKGGIMYAEKKNRKYGGNEQSRSGYVYSGK